MPPNIIKRIVRDFVHAHPEFVKEVGKDLLEGIDPEEWVEEATKPGETPDFLLLHLATYCLQTSAACVASGQPKELEQVIWKSCPRQSFDEHNALFVLRASGAWQAVREKTLRYV